MKEWVKKLVRVLLGDYAIYYIFSRSKEEEPLSCQVAPVGCRVESIDEVALNSSPEFLIEKQLEYAGTESHIYGCFENGRIVAVCFYWFGERYKKRGFWPLASEEAKLVQIISLPSVRGRGVATMLIGSSSQDMIQKGFSRLYARIWHSNTPSLRAFERAGWVRVALVVEINPLRRNRPFRIYMGLKPLGQKS